MTWKTENALKRVFNVFKRFKEQKGTLWDNDIEALKLLQETLLVTQKTNVIDNILFGKLLLYVLDRNLHQNGDIKQSIKIVSDILKEPINELILKLQITLNHKEFENHLKEINFDLDILNNKNQDELLKQNKNSIFEKLKSNWTFEKVESSFYKSANEFLKEIENYK